MTAAGVGHPDWQAYANWRGSLFQVENQHYPVGTNVIGSFQVQNYASVYVSIVQISGIGEIQFDWFADNSGAFLTEQVTYTLQGSTTLNVVLPCAGNVLGVVLTNNTVADIVIDLNILPMNLAPARPQYHVDRGCIGELPTSVPANTVHPVVTNPISGGLAWVMFDPGDGVGKFTFKLIALDQNGGFFLTFCFFNLPTTVQQQLIVMPAMPWFPQIKNTDGASSHTMEWAITFTGN